MADSPVVKEPLDPKEQPILDQLLKIRDDLLILKSDKSRYVKSQDVLTHYQKVLDQTAKLNEIRESKKDEQNRLDTVLDDCFQLISLFFLTVGRNNEAPAAYSMTSTIKRLVDHLKEAGFYSHKDLHGIHDMLEKVKDSVERGKADHSPHLLTLLEARIHACEAVLTELEEPLALIPKELDPINEKLVSILRSLSGLGTKPRFPLQEVKDFEKQLRDIEERLEGRPVAHPPSDVSPEQRYQDNLRHMSYDTNAAIGGRAVVGGLLTRCLLWAELIQQRQGKVDERFRETFDGLAAVKNQLDKLSMTRAWSLRETDLYGFQRKLARYDEARVNGNFVDAQGNPAEIYEQRMLLYLLRKSYANILYLLTSSEPVSEALQPIYNQLLTLRRCLVEVKRSGGVSSPRELYPYSMKLNSIDNMREDGKFIVNGDVPEGQASVISLLSECFDLAYELRTDAERDSDDGAERDPIGAISKAAEVTPKQNSSPNVEVQVQ